jgi:hypothetical protein
MDDLVERWKLRNACALALEQAIDHMSAALADATDDALVELIDGFAPGRAPSPEYAATLDRLLEMLWDIAPRRMPALHAVYSARNPRQWVAVANKLAPEAGERRARERLQPPGVRRPAVILR